MIMDIKKSVIFPALIIVVALVLVNIIGRNWFIRFDLTENKMYSLSESSRLVVNKIDDLLTMKVYFSDNLPGRYGNNRRYLQDILEEYAAYSDGDIRFEFYQPESDEELGKEAQKSGIQPVQVQVIEKDKLEVKKVYMGMVILYEDQQEIIPLIQTTTGLEYEITTKIKKLVEKDKRIVAIAKTDNRDLSTQNVETLLRQRYQVRNINLTNNVPDDVDVILVSGVEDSLSEDVRTNLKEFISRGGNVFISQNRVKAELQKQQANVIISDIFDLLKSYGFYLVDNLVLDRTCGHVSVQQNMGFIRMNVPMEYPFIPIIRSFNQDEPLVNGLEQCQLIFPSEIQLDSIPDGRNVTVTPLMTTSDNSSMMSGYFNLNPDPKMNPSLTRLNKPRKTVAARSEIIDEETGVVSQMILISDSRFLLDSGGGSIPENHIFLMNAVDFLMGDRELIALRSREITNRPLQEITDSAKKRWKWANIILPSLLIISFGIFRMKRQSKQSKMLEEMYD